MIMVSIPTSSGTSSAAAPPVGRATNLLVVYLVLLLAVPSNLSLGSLASLGRPSFLWGLVLAVWWMLHQLHQPTAPGRHVWQPVRYAFLIFFASVLVSFAGAMFRGEPPDQVSPAFTAVLRVVSWGGVLLVALDGIRTQTELTTVIRRLTIAAGLIAALGLAQFVSGRTFLDWLSGIPGVAYESAGIAGRDSFVRASATAAHPLEYAVVVTGCLPLALLAAITDGFRPPDRRRVHIRWWVPAALMSLSSLLSVSRSAIIGLAVAVVATLPAMSRPYRRAVLIAAPVVAMGVAALVPGLFSTMLALFTGSSEDPSTQSRSNALARLPEFISSSPFVGIGFGTFLPRYYIFDDEWALLAVEVGVLGALAFLAIAVAGIWSSIWSSHVSSDPDTIMVGRGIAASILTLIVLFAFFDALSFPMSGGMYVLFAGLGGALHKITADRVATDADARRASRLPSLITERRRR